MCLKTLVFTVSLALLPGCARDLPANEVVIGAIVDRTGTNADPSWAQAIRLAETHLNVALGESGAFGTQRFSVSLSDSANDPQRAVSHARRLVEEQHAKALLLDSSENSTAVNRLYYDFDTTNDLGVPLQCSGCTSSLVNNPLATDNDGIKQEALRNAKQWMFVGIGSEELVSLVLLREFIRHSSCVAGDCNADAVLKMVTYGPDDLEGRSSAAAIKKYALLLRPGSPPVLEQHFHAKDGDPSSYDWSGDLAELVSVTDETGGGAVALPDLISISTYAQYYVPVMRLFPKSTSRIHLAQPEGFRIGSVLHSLGPLAEGHEGISQVVYERDASGEIFQQEYVRATGLAPEYRAAHYYDNAVTLMLAVLVAGRDLDDSTLVTGEQVRQALLELGAPSGEVIRTGPEELAKAVTLIREGRAINYEGASGPMDLNAFQRVQNRLSAYRSEGGRYVDHAFFDCVANGDVNDLAACPPVP